MEGIAIVLRTARQLTSNLAQAEEFTLMVSFAAFVFERQNLDQ
jgi:hypothetical protein